MTLKPTCRVRRAFSLFEALAVIIVVAIAVPPIAAIASSRAMAVSDATRRHAAMLLAAGVMESILADSESTSTDLGFEGFARADYLTAPVIGLRPRLTEMAEPAGALGVSYDVAIGSCVDADGSPASDDAPGALRLITATASWTNAQGDPESLPLSTLVVNR